MFRLLKTKALKAGLSPGTLVYVGDDKDEQVQISLIDYDKDNYNSKVLEGLEECRQLKDSPTVTWINVDGVHDVSQIEKLCRQFDIHPLIVEDIVNSTQRPKVDVFDDYLYLVLRMHRFGEKGGEILSEQVSLVLGRNFLLTFQEKQGDTFDSVRNRIKNNKGKVRKMGADYLAYALIDSVIDSFFSVLERTGEEIEELEDELVSEPTPETLQKIHVLKREMILLRKSVWPLREVISALQREETEFITDAISVFIKDLYDHTIQIIDTVETFRDLIGGMLDIYLSSISNKMNEVMKVLTIFAALFIPLTFIAGIYGMNFNPAVSPFNMPELNWFYGYPFALVLMAVTVSGLLVYFRRKRWL